MRKLSEAMTRLAALQGRAPREQAAGTLVELDGFGTNPGALRAKMHLPATLAERPALVVVLHGCTQTADGYDVGSGWSQMADRHGFALLFPEQQRHNNPHLCFNWFSPQDNRRDQGEAHSIRQMIAAMIERHGIDPARVFVTGLSAGGAMASVMLATYPEVFAGGAIIAGLPYASAATVPQALERMRGQGTPAPAELAALVRAASPHRGPWPIISVWHGSGDATVNPNNAEAIIGQWRGLHGVAAAPTRVETIDGYPRRTWCNQAGEAVIEDYSITGMGHGTPLDTACADGCGASGAFMLEASISSTQHICRFFGLAEGVPAAARPGVASDRVQERALVPHAATAERAPPTAARPDLPPPPRAPAGVGKVIEDALRAAGLMR